MRIVLRIVVGILSVLAGMVAAILCIAATGGPDIAALLLAATCMLVGFLGLSVTRGAESPFRPTRIALALSIPPTAYMLASLPWPPGPELGSFVVLALGLTLSVCAIGLLQRRPLIAACILAILAAYGTFMLARFGQHLVSADSDWGRMGPARTLAFVLAASVGTAWIAALWHSRSIWRGANRHHAAAT